MEEQMEILDRKELIQKIVEMTKCTEEEVAAYLRTGDKYIDSLPENIESIDGDEQLEYIFQNCELEIEKIEQISNAEFELLYK